MGLPLEAARPRGGTGGADERPRGYCVGRSTWRNVRVLMSRNIGVRGGSSFGVRNSVSKL